MKKKAIIAVSVCIPVLAIIAFFIATYLSIILDKTDYHWEFAQSHTEVKEIKIIDIQYKENVTLKEIDVSLVENVFEDVQSLTFHRYGPNLTDQHGKAIMIVFNNSEFDLITCWEPEHYRYDYNDYVIYGHTSWLHCDETEFDALINKYLAM